MGSRWFKTLMALMVLFVGQMVLRAYYSNRADADNNIELSAKEFIESFGQDHHAAIIEYGNKKVTIYGIVCDVLEGNPPSGVTLRGSHMNCRAPLLIECEYWSKRKHEYRQVGPGADIFIRGHVMKKQDIPGRIKMDYCRLIAGY